MNGAGIRKVPSTLHDCFTFISENGEAMKNLKCNSDNPMYSIVCRNVPDIIRNELNLDCDNYHIKGFPGSGSWSHNIFIAILDQKVSRGLNGLTPSRGIFPLYLFSKNCKTIYLAYMIGIGTFSERSVITLVSNLRNKIPHNGFHDDVSLMDIGSKYHDYSSATIFYKEYNYDNIPSEETLLSDLNLIMDIHTTVIDSGLFNELRFAMTR